MRTAGDGCIGTGGDTFSRHQMALLCPRPLQSHNEKKEERREKREARDLPKGSSAPWMQTVECHP